MIAYRNRDMQVLGPFSPGLEDHGILDHGSNMQALGGSGPEDPCHVDMTHHTCVAGISSSRGREEGISGS